MVKKPYYKICQMLAGFTLIEMLVVMSIVALLLSIALPRYFGSLEVAKEVVLKENLKTMREVIDKYYFDKGHYPSNLEALVQEQYLKSLPIDPFTDSSKTWIMVTRPQDVGGGISDIKSGYLGANKEGLLFDQF